MKTLLATGIFATLAIFNSALRANSIAPPQVYVAGEIHNSGAFDVGEAPESLAQLLNRAGGLSVTKDELKLYSKGNPIKDLKIFLYREQKKTEFEVNPNDERIWSLIIQPQDTIEVSRMNPFKFGIFSMSLKLIQPKKQNKAEMATPRKPSDQF